MRLATTLGLIGLLAITSGCDSSSSKKGTVGKLTFEFEEAIHVPAGQTIDRLVAAVPVAGETFYAFVRTDGTGKHLSWVMEPEPGAGIGPVQPLDTGVAIGDIDQVQVIGKQVGARWLCFVISSGRDLWTGYVTILPTTQPQYLISEIKPVDTAGDEASITQLQLTAAPDSDTAAIAWTKPDALAGTVQLRAATVTGFLGAQLNINEVFDSGPIDLSAADHAPAFGDGEQWNGQLQGAFLASSGNPALLLGHYNPTAFTPDVTPLIVEVGPTGLTQLTSPDLFTPFHPTEATFAAPPTVEACPNDSITSTDEWILTAHGGGHTPITTVREVKYNCPEDPAQTLFDNDYWVLTGSGPDHHLAITERKPLVLPEAATAHVFVYDGTAAEVTVRSSSTLARIASLIFATTAPPPTDLEFDALEGVGSDTYSAIRIYGHNDQGIWIAERSVDADTFTPSS
ncbi:MAG: hypothetical protein ABI743_05815 [bacterium]